MNATELKSLYQATPFKPFELVLPNGSAVLVDHPEFMMFSPDFRTVYTSKIDGGVHFLDVKMIVGLNVPPEVHRKRARGKK